MAEPIRIKFPGAVYHASNTPVLFSFPLVIEPKLSKLSFRSQINSPLLLPSSDIELGRALFSFELTPAVCTQSPATLKVASWH
jgi:hypothetical protein